MPTHAAIGESKVQGTRVLKSRSSSVVDCEERCLSREISETDRSTADMERTTTTQPGTGRLRASKACKACHDRRVKCDAFEHGIPCSRCKRMALDDCDLIKSRRGTYARPNKRSGRAAVDQHPGPGDKTVTILDPDSITVVRTAQECDSTANFNESHEAEAIEKTSGTLQQRPGHAVHQGAHSRASLAEDQSLQTLDLTTPDSQVSDASRTSYREATWTSMFEHVLSTRRGQDPAAIDKCSITYLGETFPLALVLEDLKKDGRTRLHHPGPPMPDENAGTGAEQQHPNHLPPEETQFLRAKGSFDYPQREVIDAFTSTFVERVYPCYPIVNLPEFRNQLEQKRLPWLLLQSFCFICSTFCPLSVLYQARFQSRKEARAHFYSRAKALFDTGYEVDKIVILQSVILLAFWAGGPNDYRNFYSWNSTGITVAEAIGVHRSMNEANLRQEDVNLLRRLWWVLAIRDASCGALIGRPFRINMYYCDTEMLVEANFDDRLAQSGIVTSGLHRTSGLYQIHMAKLSLILRQIVKQKYDVKNGRTETSNLNDSLRQWQEQLPDCLKFSTNPDNVFSQCLAMVYDHHSILANLDKAIFTLPTPGEEGMLTMNSITLVSNAAQRILKLACGIVRKSIQASMPHECFPALFLAEVVFYAQMRSPQPHRAALGQSSVNTCQMVWHNLLDTWDSAPWVMKMFDTLIKNAQEESSIAEANLTVPQTATQALPTFEVADIDFGEVPELWQTHPMLSSMFDIPMDYGQSGINGVPFMFADMDDPLESGR